MNTTNIVHPEETYSLREFRQRDLRPIHNIRQRSLIRVVARITASRATGRGAVIVIVGYRLHTGEGK